MNLREAAQQALEALEHITRHFSRIPSTLADSEARGQAHAAITALRTAIEQAAEPVAWVCTHYEEGVENDVDYYQDDIDALPVGTPLYITPPAAKRQSARSAWVWLTDEEVLRVWLSPEAGKIPHCDRYLHYYRAIEAKLKEKNND